MVPRSRFVRTPLKRKPLSRGGFFARCFLGRARPAGCAASMDTPPWVGMGPLARAGGQSSITEKMPARPPKSPTSEKTVTIFTSLHPLISKWWWMGLILKMRLPWVSLK